MISSSIYGFHSMGLVSRAQGKGYNGGKTAAYGDGLFGDDKEKEAGAVKERGKQSLLDDAGEAGKRKGETPKTETESRIVVKPDGTKILVITVRCGQSVKVKSLKLCDGADMENKGANESTLMEQQVEEQVVKEKMTGNVQEENAGSSPVDGGINSLGLDMAMQ